MSNWPSEIKRYRKRNGIKQEAFAEMMSVDQATVSRWENGRLEPSLMNQRLIHDLIYQGSRSDRALFSFIEHMPCISAIFDEDGEAIVASRPAEKFFGGALTHANISNKLGYPHFVYEEMHKERGFFRGDLISSCGKFLIRLPNISGVIPIASHDVYMKLSSGKPVRLNSITLLDESEAETLKEGGLVYSHVEA